MQQHTDIIHTTQQRAQNTSVFLVQHEQYTLYMDILRHLLSQTTRQLHQAESVTAAMYTT